MCNEAALKLIDMLVASTAKVIALLMQYNCMT